MMDLVRRISIRVALMRLAERPAQRLRPIRDEDQVNVVGHEAVGPDRDAMLAALLRELSSMRRSWWCAAPDRMKLGIFMLLFVL